MTDSLSTGKYQIKMDKGRVDIFKNEEGKQEFLAACIDPALAMDLVEGLMLVEAKRKQYPNAKPVVNMAPPERKH